MGKCRFDALWLDRGTFKPWLKAVQHEACCTLCKKDIKFGTLGVIALESHAKSQKHQTCIRALQQTRPLPLVPLPPPGGSDDVPAPAAPPPANPPPARRCPTGTIDQALESSPTLLFGSDLTKIGPNSLKIGRNLAQNCEKLGSLPACG